MTRYYYIVEAVKDRVKRVFVVAPGLKMTEDTRTADQILTSASEKGMETRYCSNFHGIRWHHYQAIEGMVLARFGVQRMYDTGVNIDVVACIVEFVP